MRIIDDTRAKHIFSDKSGHIPDTADNRRLLEDVANDPHAWLGYDRYGKSWYARIDAIGRQVWVEVRDGRIVSGGINDAPRRLSPHTGLSAPAKKQWRKNHGND
jgi:filamentous hemagglutinin